MKKNNWKVALIVTAGVVAVILLCVFGVQSSQNTAYSLEEQVNTAMSDIKVQEKRRDYVCTKLLTSYPMATMLRN